MIFVLFSYYSLKQIRGKDIVIFIYLFRIINYINFYTTSKKLYIAHINYDVLH